MLLHRGPAHPKELRHFVMRPSKALHHHYDQTLFGAEPIERKRKAGFHPRLVVTGARVA
jgi:hypothetical protein